MIFKFSNSPVDWIYIDGVELVEIKNNYNQPVAKGEFRDIEIILYGSEIEKNTGMPRKFCLKSNQHIYLLNNEGKTIEKIN